MALYALNANGSQGWIEIEIGETECTGRLQYDFDPTGAPIDKSGEIVNGRVDRSMPYSVVIEFDRGRDENPYRHKGWLSEDGRVIAGYFTKGDEGYQIGWYATRFA